MLTAVKDDKNSQKNPLTFVGKDDENMSFEEMNNTILEKNEKIKHDDENENIFDLKDAAIR